MRYNDKRKAILAAVDISLLCLATYGSVLIRLPGRDSFVDSYGVSAVVVTVVYFMCLYIFDLYNPKYKLTSIVYFARFFFAMLTATLITAMSFYFFPALKIGRGILLIDSLLIFSGLYIWRLLYTLFSVATMRPTVIAIVGCGRSGLSMYNVLCKNSYFTVKGFIEDGLLKHECREMPLPFIGTSESLPELAKQKAINAVVVAATNEQSPGMLACLLEAKMRGVEIYDMPSLYEELTGKLPVHHLGKDWLAYASFFGVKRTLYGTSIKRLLDLFFSCIGAVVTLPVLLLTAAAIKIDSSGPVLFRQKRVGLDGKEFEMLKLRSMRTDAEKEGEAVWAAENDPRLTRVGKVIRKLRIDEIPQIWNVLKGEMSFIGPRPERPEFVNLLKKSIPFYAVRHSVKPGITGWAQTHYRYGASAADSLEKLQYDLYYIKNLTPFLDLQTLLKTVRVVLFARGGR